jgi:hypothetical protein
LIVIDHEDEAGACSADLETQLMQLYSFSDDMILVALASALGRRLRESVLGQAISPCLAIQLQAKLESALLGLDERAQ